MDKHFPSLFLCVYEHSCMYTHVDYNLGQFMDKEEVDLSKNKNLQQWKEFISEEQDLFFCLLFPVAAWNPQSHPEYGPWEDTGALGTVYRLRYLQREGEISVKFISHQWEFSTGSNHSTGQDSGKGSFTGQQSYKYLYFIFSSRSSWWYILETYPSRYFPCPGIVSNGLSALSKLSHIKLLSAFLYSVHKNEFDVLERK